MRKVSNGILIAFDDAPPPLLRYPLEIPSNNKTADLLHAVQKLRLSQAIEEVVDTTSPGYYSRLFLVPKPDGSFRPIIDLKKLNQFIIVPSFKMETLFSIIAALQPNEWITKIDLKDAYHHILVHVNIRKYFRFVVAGTVYQFRVLPFGLYTAPREFTKTLAPVVHLLRSRGIQVHAYLDDWIIRASTKELSLLHTQQVLQLLQSLGWTINWDKSMLQPTRILDFLGLHFNLEQALISPPDSFLPTLTEVLSRLSPSTVMSARKVSSIISRLSHFAPFITHGRLHLRFLQLWFKEQWTQHRQSWDTQIKLDSEFLSYLRWFLHPSVMTGVPLRLPDPSLFFFTDASLKGWGASWQTQQLSGVWSQQESKRHINWLELEAIRLALLHWGLQWSHQTVRVYCDNSTAVAYIRKQGGTHSKALFHKTLELYQLLDQYRIILIPTHLPGARNVTADALSRLNQPSRMASSTSNLKQTVLCLGDSPDRYVRNSGEQSDAHLRFALPRRQSLGGRRPVPILGRFGPDLRLSPGSHSAQNDPEDTEIPRHHGHSDSISTPITTVAPSIAPVEHASQDSPDRRSTIPVCTQHPTTSIPQRSHTVGSGRVALIRDILKSHRIPDTVVDMAADPLRDSSSHVYNSHWKAFALWANEKGLHPKDLSFFTLAEYLVHLFSLNKKVNTILVHKASISSVLKLLNPSTTLQETTLQNVIRRMTLLRPREQEVLPRWHLSVVLKGLMKPPFTINGSDRQLSLELLSYKTAFLVALASGARGSELVALSRASHNLDFSMLPSGAKQVSIRMVPKFIPKNQRPEVIPKPIVFPGMAHLFPKDPERLLCPVRALGLYIVRSAERAQTDPLEKLFVHFTPNTQLFTTHFRRWVAETIRLTYENSSQSDLPKIKAHDVRGISASIAYYRNTPLKELCGLIGWKSSNVFVRHYLRDMASDTELQDIPLVAARTAFL